MSRSTSRCIVDASLSMTAHDLLRIARIRSGQDGGDAMCWHWQPYGDPVGSIRFWIATSDPDTSHVRLIYNLDGAGVDDRVQLARTPCRFGGWRWWFTCPVLGCRVVKLHMPLGGHRFASRRAWRLAYQSNRETELQCAHDRIRRLYRKLGTNYPYGILGRPKGMHRETYVRLLAAIEEAELRLFSVPWGRRVMRMIERHG